MYMHLSITGLVYTRRSRISPAGDTATFPLRTCTPVLFYRYLD